MNIYRWHPLLTASMDGPMVGTTPLHLHQSDIDGACGIHAALMALMILNLVDRDDLEKPPISKTKKKSLARFWKHCSPYYFSGALPDELKTVFKPFKKEVCCKVLDKRPVNEAAATLQADGLCIAGLTNTTFDHWVLIVGIGGKEGSASLDRFLILDPALPPLPMLPWNATLTVNPSRRGLHRYETANGDCKVYFEDALLLTPNINEADLELGLDLELELEPETD